MNKLTIVIIFLLLLMLTGCPEDPGGDVDRTQPITTGIINDLAGRPVPGMLVTIGNVSATTDSVGRFSMNITTPGEYVMSGAGGKDAHYLISDTTVAVGKARLTSLGEYTAYQLGGRGVVIQGAKARGDEGLRALKYSIFPLEENSQSGDEMDGGRGMPSRSRDYIAGSNPAAPGVPLFAAPAYFVSDNISLIALQWEAVSIQALSRYVMYLVTPDNEVQVWSSDAVPVEDPAFNPDSPAAYLDFDDELAAYVDGPGDYTLHVQGITFNGTVVVDFPFITVPVALTLTTYPTGIGYERGELSWTDVPGASGYRVRIYAEDVAGDLVFDSGAELVEGGNVIPQLPGNGYYQCYIDAIVLDKTGWPAEMTRGISGFMVE